MFLNGVCHYIEMFKIYLWLSGKSISKFPMSFRSWKYTLYGSMLWISAWPPIIVEINSLNNRNIWCNTRNVQKIFNYQKQIYIKYFWKSHSSNLISLWRLPTVSGSLLTINFIVLEETSVVKICTGTSDERLGIPRSYALTIKVITGSTKFIAPPFNPTIEKNTLIMIAYQ